MILNCKMAIKQINLCKGSVAEKERTESESNAVPRTVAKGEHTRPTGTTKIFLWKLLHPTFRLEISTVFPNGIHAVHRVDGDNHGLGRGCVVTTLLVLRMGQVRHSVPGRRRCEWK